MLPRHWLAAVAMVVVLSGCSGGSSQTVQGPPSGLPADPAPPGDPAPSGDTVENILNLRMTVATDPDS